MRAGRPAGRRTRSPAPSEADAGGARGRRDVAAGAGPSSTGRRRAGPRRRARRRSSTATASRSSPSARWLSRRIAPLAAHFAPRTPPSTNSPDPRTNRDSSEARNRAAAATSSGRPRSPVSCRREGLQAGGRIVVALGEVAVHERRVDRPRQQRVDADPVLSHSPPASAGSAPAPRPWMRRTTPGRARPISAIVDDMLMIDPRCAATMTGRTARATRKTPRTLTAMTRSQSSSDVSSTVPTPAIPALLNSTSIRPHRANDLRRRPLAHESAVGDVHADTASGDVRAADGGLASRTVSCAASRVDVRHRDARSLLGESERRSPGRSRSRLR